MGRQSQLGPIDPFIPLGGRSASAGALTEGFKRATESIKGDTDLAHVWYPVLQHLDPALLTEAQNALDYGKRMVTGRKAAQRVIKRA